MKIVLAEPLHLVLQGEGIHLGKKMILMRLVGCNVQCPDCDTSYTWSPDVWNKKQFLRYSIDELTREIIKIQNQYQISHVLITGGEPALWKHQIRLLIQKLLPYQFYFDIETSGYDSWDSFKTREIEDSIQFNISPKLGALQPKNGWGKKAISILEKPPLYYIVKVVVSSSTLERDLKNIEKLKKNYNIPDHRIYLMPFAKKRDEILKQADMILKMCFRYGYEFSPRLHILIFDEERLK